MKNFQQLDPEDYKQEEDFREAMKRSFEALGWEQNAFVGYVQIKLNMTAQVFNNKLSGRTRFRPYEMEQLPKIVEEKPWRSI